LIVAHAAGNHHARVNAGVQRKRSFQLNGKRFVVLLHGLHHVQRGAKGEFGIIFVRNGRAENGHDAIANKFVDMAFVASDNLGQVAHAAVHETGDYFRIQLFAHGGEAADVGEQHRDIAALGILRIDGVLRSGYGVGG
jgi:hypothetical protein